MKNILTKIEVHYTYIIIALGFVLTGYFSNLIIFTSIIIIHELGHVLIGLYYKYPLDKIIIYPYGGITKFNTLINTNINKDLLLAISGIIMQSIYYIIITILYNNGYIREYIYNIFTIYHYAIFYFNIMPIIPLDGSKIVNLILSKYLNFNLSNKLSIVISLLTIIIILTSKIFEYNYSFIIILTLLMKNIYDTYKNIEYVYNKFVLERYLYNITYPHIKIINNTKHMYKNKRHYFNINNKIIKEKDYLNNLYNPKNKSFKKKPYNHLTNR